MIELAPVCSNNLQIYGNNINFAPDMLKKCMTKTHFMSKGKKPLVKGLPEIPLYTGRPFTFDRVARILFGLGVLFGVIWLINILSGVLLPFLVAWLIAYILEPFVQYNQRLLGVKQRWLPVFVTLFEACLLFAVMCFFFVPSIISEMHQVAGFIRHYSQGGATVAFIPESLHEYLRTTIDFDTIARELTRQDIRSILETTGNFIAGGYNIVMGVFNWFIVALYVVFIMLDYEKLIRGTRRMIPPKYREMVTTIADDIKNSMNHYFRGQALIAMCVGIMFCIGFLIIKLPMAIVLGLFIGLLNMVPYLQLISLVPTTLLCLVYSVEADVDFWHIWWSAMLVYIVVQAIQDLILTPRIMGNAMGLNPALILFSLSVWGTVLGFIGLIIALPLTTLLIAYYGFYISSQENELAPPE